MPYFSDLSLKRLGTCTATLQHLFMEIIKHYDCTILCGHRSKEEQETAYSRGLTRLRYPSSWHNHIPARAVDAIPWHRTYPHIRWNDRDRIYNFAGYVLGIAQGLSIGIRWGGDWDSDTELDDQTFMDLVHFELVEGE